MDDGNILISEGERSRVVELYPMAEVLPLILDSTKKKTKVEFKGHTVKVSSLRLVTFKVKGTTCVTCGMEATHFGLMHGTHAKDGPVHFNLYRQHDDGGLTLFTKDHIVPKSKGGPETLENMQVMCSPCNRKKGDKYVEAI